MSIIFNTFFCTILAQFDTYCIFLFDQTIKVLNVNCVSKITALKKELLKQIYIFKVLNKDEARLLERAIEAPEDSNAVGQHSQPMSYEVGLHGGPNPPLRHLLMTMSLYPSKIPKIIYQSLFFIAVTSYFVTIQVGCHIECSIGWESLSKPSSSVLLSSRPCVSRHPWTMVP